MSVEQNIATIKKFVDVGLNQKSIDSIQKKQAVSIKYFSLKFQS